MRCQGRFKLRCYRQCIDCCCAAKTGCVASLQVSASHCGKMDGRAKIPNRSGWGNSWPCVARLPRTEIQPLLRPFSPSMARIPHGRGTNRSEGRAWRTAAAGIILNFSGGRSGLVRILGLQLLETDSWPARDLAIRPSSGSTGLWCKNDQPIP